MSTPAEIWKNPFIKIARTRAHSEPAKIVLPARAESYQNTMSSLARQLFFPNRDVRRTSVLLAGTGPGTDITGFAEDLGKALSDLADESVALIEDSTQLSEAALQERSGPKNSSDAWRRCGSQISERVWRVPGFLFAGTNVAQQFVTLEDLPFQYRIFAATVTDSMFRVFCNQSQGVVLALMANRTRRGSALQAQRILHEYKTTLLGTVLLGRQFPIPESIYRRL